MNNVKQCSVCGNLFQSYGSKLCPACAEEMERCFRVVKDYVYDHPDASLMTITKDTGVSEKMVLDFLREGRLSMSAAESFLACEECGAPIQGGRYCAECQVKLENMLNRAYKPIPVTKEKVKEIKTYSPGRMHISHEK